MASQTLFSDLARRLRRTDLLLLRAVRRQRARPAMRAKGQFWGSVITDDEVDALLRAHGEIDYPLGADGLDDAIAASAAYRDAPGGRFSKFRNAFDLDGDDIDLMLLSLAPEISAGYGKIFAYLNDNLNQAYLTVDLATRVLRQERRQRLALQSRLLPGSPLIQNRLLLLNPPDGMDTHTSRRVHPAPRLLRWLLLGSGISFSDGAKPLESNTEPFISGQARDRINTLRGSLDSPITVALVGGTSGAREGAAISISRLANRPIVRVDVERAKKYLQEPYNLVRDLRIDGAIPYIINIPDTDEEPALRLQMMGLGTAIASLPYTVCVGGNDRRALAAMLGQDRPNVTVAVGRSTKPEREDAWGEALEERGWDRNKALEVAERFYSIGGTTIQRVLDRAEAESGGKEPADELIWSACRELSRPEFSGLAQRVIPRYNWDDLILPEKTVGQLKHLENYLAQQEKVMFQWGGQKVRPRGYGIKALFSGAPGTGKTMCAEVIAGSLGLDLFKVDLSSVISRWVGETEKNLKEIFDAAEGGSSVVLFDEGDALFGSRGEVKGAQDKFANQEVSFLLQRLEVFEGCAIITTNLQENIDEAFLRRFGAVIEFPVPTPRERFHLWNRMIPSGAPRKPDLDIEYLAQQFHISGGSIVNAAINACVVAASEDDDVGMKHVIFAVARELHKMGKQINRVHFGEYFDAVEDLF
ncbi:MAG: ATP-binding protein [Proteobacteria bacterium]|jgi:AAA+ superfamily predicted ATPase|nr:ATP-binding protein [Pseudomonadota bacterium]